MGKAILFAKGPLLVKVIVKALEAESWREIAVLQISINNCLFGKIIFFKYSSKTTLYLLDSFGF